MEGFMMLSMLSLAMFFGSYLAGSVPLAMTFSESKLRFVSIFGAGLLVGTALAVIIPEGVQSIYEAESELHNRQFHKEAEHILEESAHQPPFNPPRIPPKDAEVNPPNDAKVPVPEGADKNVPKSTDTENRDKREPDAEGPPNVRKPLQIKAAVEKSSELSGKGEHEHEHHHHDESLSHHAHSVIGVALVAGFVFMLIVDQITRSATGRGDNGTRGRYKITATVGLVVHAAADGIALGAASSTKHSEIQFIIFVAIMLHKAPAAFGLVTFLLVEGLEKMRIRKHLLIFSLAAPLMALFTYMGIAKGGSETLTSMSSTGVLMLFSAGTFLYVSTVHVLPELVNSAPKSAGYHVVDAGGLPSNSSSSQTSLASGHSHHASHGFKLNEVFALILGAGVPALLSIGHSH